MEWLLTNFVAAWLLPPGILLLAALAGALLALRRRRAGGALVALSLAGLYVLSTPVASHALVNALEPHWSDPLADRDGEAIVILGGGTYFSAPEYGHDTVSRHTLARLRYGAKLQRALEKPVLVTGGAPLGNARSEAEQMKEVLEREFHVPVRWAEGASNNTLENARLAQRMLLEGGVRRIYLVTDAWHMRRARLVFERAGLAVIPAPTVYYTFHRRTALDFIPNAGALMRSSEFFHEVIGIGWYHLRLALGR